MNLGAIQSFATESPLKADIAHIVMFSNHMLEFRTVRRPSLA